MKNQTIVFKVSDNIKEKMIEYYKDKVREKTPPYAVFQAQEEDTIVTLYESGKVMFQGISADIDANMWKDQEKFLNNRDIDTTPSEEKKKEVDKTNYYYSTIGSDEVGVGDYFLPIVVTASFMDKEDIKFLESLGVHDSKKLSDDKILSKAPLIMKKIPYESYVLSNKEYNRLTKEGYNNNKIKAILHNDMIFKLVNRGYKYEKIIVDEFTKPWFYYSHLEDESNVVRGITFITQAEDKNLAVACSSIISRYLFLKEKEKLEEELGMEVPKGAGDKVDIFGKELVKLKGKSILFDIAKVSFKNTDKILS